MPSAHRSPTQSLRVAIDCLPRRTRQAMLDGIRANPVIAGAYVDGRGGICPMLAAHRNGGRTDCEGFALAWDRFAGVRRNGEPRRVSDRELHVLVTQLEASLHGDDGVPLRDAIASHQTLARGRRGREAARDGAWDFLDEPLLFVPDFDPDQDPAPESTI